MALIGQSKIDIGVNSKGFIFLPLNFLVLVAIFATNFFGVSGSISKCAAKFLEVGGLLPLTTF